jgi:hypothetical protein
MGWNMPSTEVEKAHFRLASRVAKLEIDVEELKGHLIFGYDKTLSSGQSHTWFQGCCKDCKFFSPKKLVDERGFVGVGKIGPVYSHKMCNVFNMDIDEFTIQECTYREHKGSTE